MKSIKWTETEKNLLKSFAWESQARMRYDYFASVAKKEWYEEISAIFSETALNEKEHAKRFWSYLEWDTVEITAMYPAWKTCSTLENLEAAANWENEEWTELYKEFAEMAEKEWFYEIATLWRLISEIEKTHEVRYRRLAQDIKNSEVFSKSTEVSWKCRNCWHIHYWTQAPNKCPACLHPQAYFETINC